MSIFVCRTRLLALPCRAALAFQGATLAATATPMASELSPVSGLVQMLLAMGLVLGVIFALAWLMRRVNPMALAGSQAALRVISGVMVGQRERVVIVEVQGKWLVLGVAAQSVTLLHTLDRPEDLPASPSVTTGPFADKLRALLESRGISLPKKPS